jgi:hypothetical protein
MIPPVPLLLFCKFLYEYSPIYGPEIIIRTYNEGRKIPGHPLPCSIVEDVCTSE